MINPKNNVWCDFYISIHQRLYSVKNGHIICFVGAFPGAIPFMLGWVAATGDFGIEAGTLF
jgi:protoheme IX farnesyltransferase